MAGDDRGKGTCDRGWAELKIQEYIVAPERKGGLRAAPSGCTGH